MRYRLLASYEGAPYEAGIGPDDSGVVLFAACPPPEDLRFEPATGHWRKKVNRADVQMIYESRPVGTFRGEQCVVLDDLNERLHIAYLGHDAHLASRLGYWEVDRGVFELITPRHEVTDIVEQRLPLHEDGQAPDRGDASVPVVDEGPLPLEAEAMRAASEAVRTGKKEKAGRSPSLPSAAASDADRVGRHEPAQPALPGSSAGLSEPSNVPKHATDGGASVPSWTPQAHVTPVNGVMHGGRVRPAGTPLEPAPGHDAAVRQPAGQHRHESTVALAAAPLTDVAPAAPTDLPVQDLARSEPVPSDPAAVPLGRAPDASESVASELTARHALRRGRTSRRRLPTQRIFSELAAQAAIPANAYAIGEDVDGAMCLVKTDDGFEVFNSLAGSRHEVRLFPDEESAYFYLFGVLVADAVRTGMLVPRQ